MNFSSDYIIEKVNDLNQAAFIESDHVPQPWNACFVSEHDWSINFFDQTVVSSEDIDCEDGLNSEINKFTADMILSLAHQYGKEETLFQINQRFENES